MPTTRRSSGGRGAVSTGKQSKLSFNNRVTKPVPKSVKDSVASSPLKKELIQEKVEKVEKDEAEDIKADEQLQQETEQQIVSIDVTKSDAELKAAKMSDAAIQKYWRKVEAERMAKRVHQEDLTLSEKVLRYFDVSSQYGVSVTSQLRESQVSFGLIPST
jgi:DNA polymerase delta subunit 4